MDSYCVNEQKQCIYWVERYFKDCLCNVTDEISFGFGLVSLVCWGLAEIPQIFTNFKTQSSHGVSILFLLTWITGDALNLIGCILEPATLPTQFYTAVLYTISTVVLVLQSLYYDYLQKCRNRAKQSEEEEDLKKPLTQNTNDQIIPVSNGAPRAIPRRGVYYYTSARSMAGSLTPPARSYLWPIKSGPSAVGIQENDSSDDDESNPTPGTTRPRPIPRSVGYGAFLATAVNMPRDANALVQASMVLAGRKLLQEHRSESALGQCLGWMMAAIYMGGRLPQIWLNIKRGSVQGMNPLMFIFALAANAAYVASILVRSIEWDKIKANLPWLLDAVGCVVLDLFIILQFVYYRYFRKASSEEEYADYDDKAAKQ